MSNKLGGMFYACSILNTVCVVLQTGSACDNFNTLKMDYFLKPKDLDVLPSVPNAVPTVKYWLATFGMFLREVVAGQEVATQP